MSTPKLFKSFSSKSSSEASPVPDHVQGNGKKDGSPKTVAMTPDGPVPEYSDGLREAWMAAQRELPQAQGAEKVLNKIGMSIIRSRVHTPTSQRSSMRTFHSVLTFTGKGVSKTV